MLNSYLSVLSTVRVWAVPLTFRVILSPFAHVLLEALSPIVILAPSELNVAVPLAPVSAKLAIDGIEVAPPTPKASAVIAPIEATIASELVVPEPT